MKCNRQNKRGFIISMELVFIAVILVFGLIAGWTALRGAVIDELWDLGQAFDGLDNGYLIKTVTWNTTGVGGGATAPTLVTDAGDPGNSLMINTNGAQNVITVTLTDTTPGVEGTGFTYP